MTDLYSYPVYRKMQKENQVFSDVAAVFSMTMMCTALLGTGREPEPMKLQLYRARILRRLGVQALMGRMMTDEDDSSEGDHPVAVVSYAWWTRALVARSSGAEQVAADGSAVSRLWALRRRSSLARR